MSEESNGDSGSRDRATVALVGAKVDEVKAIVSGLSDTTAAHFETVATRLDVMAAALVERAEAERRMAEKIEGVETRTNSRIDTVEQKVTAQEAALSHLERARTFHSNVLPGYVIGAAGIIAAIVLALLH